jgi:hypothetical protein
MNPEKEYTVDFFVIVSKLPDHVSAAIFSSIAW